MSRLAGGGVKKWVVVGKAQNGDEELLKLLLDEPILRKEFFKQIGDALVFDTQRFVWFMEMKNYLKDSYTAYKNKIGLTIDGNYLKQQSKVALAWPFKDCILQGGQTKEDDKRKEVFFHETLGQDQITQLLEPKVLTNATRYNAKGQLVFKGFTRNASINKSRNLPADTITDNLLIKGNNLLALHSLKKQFAGKVKLIYIDPPFNTGGSAETFTYNNTFNHSTWLTFMKNRLEVAKEFLREDGFIAIAIDHAELFYLGALADEVFGRDNRMGIVSVVHQARGRWMDKNFSASNEFMLVYSKQQGTNIRNVVIDPKKKEKFNLQDEKGLYYLKNFIVIQGGGGGVERKDKPKFWYSIYVSKDLTKISLVKKQGYEEVLPITSSGRELTWVTVAKTLLERFNSSEIDIKREQGKIIIYRKYREQQIIPTHWVDSKYNATSHGTILLEKIMGRKSVSYPKSLYTVLDTLKLTTEENDIVMDFFAGSGTTGHAVLELNKEDGGNRQFILVEQLEAHIAVCQERLTKVIKKQETNDSFIYAELKQHNEKFINNIEAATSVKSLTNIWKRMKNNAFLHYAVVVKQFDRNVDEFKQLSLNEQKQCLLEVLDKNQLYVNLSSLDDKDHQCSASDKKITNNFYQ